MWRDHHPASESRELSWRPWLGKLRHADCSLSLSEAWLPGASRWPWFMPLAVVHVVRGLCCEVDPGARKSRVRLEELQKMSGVSRPLNTTQGRMEEKKRSVIRSPFTRPVHCAQACELPVSRTVANSVSLFNHIRRRTAKERKVFLPRSQRPRELTRSWPEQHCCASRWMLRRESLSVHQTHATRTLPACPLPEPPCPRHPILVRSPMVL